MAHLQTSCTVVIWVYFALWPVIFSVSWRMAYTEQTFHSFLALPPQLHQWWDPVLWEPSWSTSNLRDSFSSTKQNRPLCQVFLMVQSFTRCDHTCHLMTWRASFMRITHLQSQMARQFSTRRSLQWEVLASMSTLWTAIWCTQNTLAWATWFSTGHQLSLFLYQLLLVLSRLCLDWTELWSAGDHLNTLLEPVSSVDSPWKSTSFLSREVTFWLPFLHVGFSDFNRWS